MLKKSPLLFSMALDREELLHLISYDLVAKELLNMVDHRHPLQHLQLDEDEEQ